MNRNRSTARALVMLMRDTLGRFLRIRDTAPTEPAPRRRISRRTVVAVQLALF